MIMSSFYKTIKLVKDKPNFYNIVVECLAVKFKKYNDRNKANKYFYVKERVIN